jgi:signal peptidase I
VSVGDLVLFRFEDGEEVFHVLRRVVGLPQDTVSLDSGRVVLNGTVRDLPFRIIQPLASRSPFAIGEELYDWGPWVIPPDSLALLSDTRDMIGWPDSRFIGFVALDDIIARATRTVTGRRLR